MSQSPGKTPATKKSAPPKAVEAPKKASAVKKSASGASKPATKTLPKTAASKAVSARPAAGAETKRSALRAAPKGDGESAVGVSAAAPAARSIGGVTPEQRYRMICDAAYFRAERRGFVGGNALQDWLDAEAEIDGLLREMQQ